MNRSTIGKSTALTALLLSGLLFALFARTTPAAISSDPGRFSEKVNLALRRTAHFLLLESGDSSSRIPPVLHTDSSTWLVRLERPFSYDRLPALLQESFDRHDIRDNYDVAVVDCEQGELQLGYTQLDFVENKNVPCGGREPEMACANLRVTFHTPSRPASSYAWWLLGGALLLAGIAYAAWRWSVRRRSKFPDNDSAGSDGLPFGNSSLDIANQVLISGGIQHKLTYREAKLLQLFVSRPNQLLERDFILKSVWEDEGIIVGRSVDVFVSRLRKMFREDPALKLVAVHGVGYRLEVG